MQPRCWLFLLMVAGYTSALCGQSQSSAGGSPPPLDTSIRRFEVGGQIADVRTECIGQQYCNLPSFALGAGAAMNLSPHFAIDLNGNLTPAASNGITLNSGGHASELLAGVRAEIRAKRYGFFLKAQPGFLRWSDVITGVSFPTPDTYLFKFGSRRHFVADIGAGFEYSPTARIHVRGDVGDLMERYESSNWRNNLQPEIGVYVGLGKPVQWTPPVYRPEAAHPFFGGTNIGLIYVSALGMASDAITTHRFLERGEEEGDPIARPFVKYGWSGQIALGGMELGGEVLAMYGLHRIGHHWIERLLPASIATVHGILAYNNARSLGRP